MPETIVWPIGESMCCDLVRRTDWFATQLGPIDQWPESLRSATQMLLACSFPMVVLWGQDLIQIYNDGYAEIMGNRHPEGMGQSTAQCWPEVWSFNEPVYQQVFQGNTVTFEDQLFPIQRRGTLADAYFTLCYSPCRDGNQQVAGVLVTVFETTDRKKAADALRGSEKQLRALLEASSYAIYHMSPDWSTMHILDGRGFLADTAASDRNWLQQYIVLEDQELVLKTIHDAIRTKSMFQLEHRVRKANAEVGWTLSRAVPILGLDGEIVEWVGAASDVTERKVAEEELRRAKESLTTLFGSLQIKAENLEEQVEITSEALGQTREKLQALSHHLMSAQEDEQRRIARELHDDLGQRAVLIGLRLDQLRQRSTADFLSELVFIRGDVTDLTNGLREVSHRLHPAMIADLGLPAALEALLTEYQDQYLQVRGTITPVPVLPLGAATALYRIAQEALRNVQKHAPDAAVTVRLWHEDDSVHLRIRDSGLGFSLIEQKGGLGLISMQERARLAGGILLLSADPGKGTTVLVRIPL